MHHYTTHQTRRERGYDFTMIDIIILSTLHCYNVDKYIFWFSGDEIRSGRRGNDINYNINRTGTNCRGLFKRTRRHNIIVILRYALCWKCRLVLRYNSC